MPRPGTLHRPAPKIVPPWPSIPDLVESALMASIRQDTQDIGTISWSLLASETASDTL